MSIDPLMDQPVAEAQPGPRAPSSWPSRRAVRVQLPNLVAKGVIFDRLTHQQEIECQVDLDHRFEWDELQDLTATDAWGNTFELTTVHLSDNRATLAVTSGVHVPADLSVDELECWIPAFDRLYPAAPLRYGRAIYVGRVTVKAQNWCVTLDLLHGNNHRSATPLAVTHQLRIVRPDRAEFLQSEGLEVLNRIAMGMGLWSGRPIHGWRVRLKRNGKVVGNPLVQARQLPPVTVANWAPRPGGNADGHSFDQLLALSMQRPVDYTERLLLSWYHTAIQAFTLQAGLSAASSALQLLGSLTNTTKARENFRPLMVRLLASAQLQHSELGPNRHSQGIMDVSTFVDARNETAHPKTGPSRFSSSEWVDLYRLGLKWLELVLLHRLSYSGDFMDRFSFNVVPVPWAKP